MKVLLVGSGGRESSLAWALSRSPLLEDLICSPGNPGMAKFGRIHAVSEDEHGRLIDLAVTEKVDLAVVGPEAPLVAGLADELSNNGIKVFGPNKKAAQLEGSKAWAKELMLSARIPTARYELFQDAESALGYASSVGTPLVVKADGLAAGKGVTVCADLQAAEAAIRAAMVERNFGASGDRVVIEECLEGEELSVLALTDGKTIVPMEPAQDFKRARDGDRGPNTGGMGTYSPVPACDAAMAQRIQLEVLEPIAGALRDAGVDYVGVIYAGLMLTADGPKVIEFNCRFGDPEIEALVPRLRSDLLEAMVACVDARADEIKLTWHPEACVSVMAASGGYPDNYETGFEISGVERAEEITGLPVFHAGTALEDERLVTAGGRVLAVNGLGADIKTARRSAYEGLKAVSFKDMTFRSDIAAKAAEGAS